MRLSGRTAYAVQALYDMALHGGAGRAVQAREVAERQGIPLRYLEQILQELRRTGLVEAKRGPGGGYALARPPEAIRLSDVVVALDGPLESLVFDHPQPQPHLPRQGNGAADVPTTVWRELAARVSALLDTVTIKDLVTRAEALGVRGTAAPALPQMSFI